MIDQKTTPSVPLNSYNVAQLQFALSDPKGNTLPFPEDLSPSVSPAIVSPESDVDYDSRRMSSAATSVAETDSSGGRRGEKRSLTPADLSPLKKARSNSSDPLQSNNSNANSANNISYVDAPSTSPSGDKPITVLDNGVLENPKVSLPSIFTTFEDKYRNESRRASLPTLYSDSPTSRRNAPYPPTSSARTNYTPVNQSNLSSYQFPTSSDSSSYGDSPYPHSALSNGTTPSTSSFPPSATSTFSSPLSSDYRPGLSPQYSSAPENGDWTPSPTNIVRPNSTPSQLTSPTIKYEEGLRHASFSAAPNLSHHSHHQSSQLFAGSTRISGQDRSRSFSAGVKNEWSFPAHTDFVLSPSTPTYNQTSPAMSLPGAPGLTAPANNTAVQQRTAPAVQSSTLVDRPQRKRGKLPKETTDFLKSWLHRHSDHPYPSEEEKKQLCNATGLSMSQVSNWMINARRRILAPAHRAASGPTTTAPFPPSSRTTNLLDPIGRRASMPTDSLQLYHPMSLQTLQHATSGPAASLGHEYMSGRHILGIPRSASSSYGAGGGDFGRLGSTYPHHHSHHHHAAPTLPLPPLPASHHHHHHHQPHSAPGGHHYLQSGMPLSAPPTLSSPSNPFSSHNQSMYQQQQHHHHHAGYNSGTRIQHPPPSSAPASATQSQGQESTSSTTNQTSFYAADGSHSGSASGSAYGTPQ